MENEISSGANQIDNNDEKGLQMSVPVELKVPDAVTDKTKNLVTDSELINEEEVLQKVLQMAENNYTLEEQNVRLKACIKQLRETISSSKLSVQYNSVPRPTSPCYIVQNQEDEEEFRMITGERNDEDEVLYEVKAFVENSEYLQEENSRLKKYIRQLRTAISKSKSSDSDHDNLNVGNGSQESDSFEPVSSEEFGDGGKGDTSPLVLLQEVQDISETNQNLVEQNNRLKYYIKQLRRTILMPQISDRSHSHILEECCSSHKHFASSSLVDRCDLDISVLPEGIEIGSDDDLWIPGQNPLLNSLVLQVLFRRLDYKFLKESRLVCHEWDDVAVPILSKESVISLTRWSNEQNICSEGILNLREVMEKGCLKLFNYFQIEVPLFDNPECQRLLLDFGMNLKTLEVEIDPSDTNLSPKYLYCILVDWCPKLETLEICNLKSNANEETYEQLFNTLGSIRPLQLTTFEFDVGEKDTKLAKMLISIVNASPKLNTLRGYFHPRILLEFFVNVQNNPTVTKNLKELIIHGSERNHIIPVEIFFQLDIEFSDNLKHLTLGSFNPYPRTNLLRVLKKVAKSLETLVLFGQDNSNGNNYTANEIELPSMKKLKEFKNFGAEEYRLRSMDFLANMESLETLVLSGGHNLPLAKTRLDTLFGTSIEFMRNPHLKLKKLILLGEVTSLRTILTISRIFPNLSTLYLKLGHGERGIGDSRPCEKQEWFREAAEAIFDMETLKVLYLDFREFQLAQSMESENDLTKNVGILPELQSLTLINGCETGGPKFLPYFLEAMFGKAPKLQNVKLVDFEMALTDARNLFETMNERKIILEITDDPPALEDF